MVQEREISGTGIWANVERVSGQRGLGRHWLRFKMRLRLKEKPRVQLIACQLTAHVRREGPWEESRWTAPAWQLDESRDGDAPVEFSLPLSAKQALLLDRSRDERGAAHLKLYLTLNYHRPESEGPWSAGFGSQSADFDHEISRTDWIRLLEEMAFSERAVFEVPVSGVPMPVDLAKAGVALKEAQTAFHERRWVDVLTKCRAVLDEVEHKRPIAAVASPFPLQKSWTFAERLAACAKVIRHATHRGPHGTGSGAIVGDPSREDAELVLITTALILKNSAGR